ncbi:hypothetical protein [Salsipaludibacter albus]|uniref:hypothetical protein n=1 Tax=Salsipaludibacter albus TaxID=2849650 RepID=UPI001EE4A9F6|nr:hypothetical protein [Salsipaludibacter albus]MBY5161466.1 hypothetical protein [Salsipaludibacter albus]
MLAIVLDVRVEMNPLHQDPVRPQIGQRGYVVNPLRATPSVRLDPDVPMSVHELEPDVRYRSCGFEYLTDGDGLPARVEVSWL